MDEELKNKNRKKIKDTTVILTIICFILIILIIYLASSNTIYKIKYQEAIEQGAEGIILMAELNTACRTLGNFTMQEVENKWIDMFLKNRTYREEKEENKK